MTLELENPTLKHPNQKAKNFISCFMGLFFILYLLPTVLNFYVTYIFNWFYGNFPDFVKYLWFVETDIVFLGHHAPLKTIIEEQDTCLGIQALIASLILSLVLSVIAIVLDEKYTYLSRWKDRVYPFIYVFNDRINALAMFLSGIMKLFPVQFTQVAIQPDMLLLPMGSSNAYSLFWVAYGSSIYYEIILGALEVIGGILLWFSKTTIIGALLNAILLINIVLMDIFINIPIRVLPSLMLISCLFTLWPEMKYYMQYILHRTTVNHTAATYSFIRSAQKTWQKRTLRAAKIMIALFTIIWFGLNNLGAAWRLQAYASDPWYGVWDSDTPGTYYGKYFLGNIGILRQGHHGTIALYTVNGAGIPEDIPAINIADTMSFRLSTKPAETNIPFSAHLIEHDKLILSYMHGGKTITITYHHRKTVSRNQAPRLITAEDTDRN